VYSPQQVRAIRGPGGASLFEFDDMPPHTPAGANLHDIDRSQGLHASALDDVTKIRKQCGKIVRRMQSIAVASHHDVAADTLCGLLLHVFLTLQTPLSDARYNDDARIPPTVQCAVGMVTDATKLFEAVKKR
jgi:hypothetical protein